MLKRYLMSETASFRKMATGGLLLLFSQLAWAETALPVVKVMQPQLREVTEWREFTGRFEAVERVVLRARVTGYLDAVSFQDGQLVSKGDLLFKIDPRPYQAALSRAEANLARVVSQLKLTELELQRGERLLKQQAISAEEVDTRRARYQEANANRAAAQAAVQTAALDLQYTQIHAPINGRISNRNIDVGNLITGGDMNQSLSTIVSLNPVHFVFDVSESEYLAFSRQVGGEAALTGQADLTAQIKLLDETKWAREGTIDFIDNRLDENTATLRMRVLVDNADGLLRPGIFGRLRMAIAEPAQAMLIPDRALVSDQAAKMVMVVNELGVVEAKPVEIGSLQDEMRIIRSGLKASDVVIVEGLLRARPGAEVDAQNITDSSGDP